MLIIYDFISYTDVFTYNITTLESLLIYAMKTITYQTDKKHSSTIQKYGCLFKSIRTKIKEQQ